MRLKILVLHGKAFTFASKSDDRSISNQMKELRLKDADFKECMMSAEGAERNHPGLIKRLRALLSQTDQDCKIEVYRGAKFPIYNDASDAVIKTKPSDLVHAVLVVNGGLVIDICNKRCGSGYDVPWNYPKSLLKQVWSHLDEAKTKAASITKEQAAQAFRQMTNNSNSKQPKTSLLGA